MRTIQKAGPSAETAGKTKRTATAEVHEGGHGEVDEGVGVLDDAAHVGDAVEVEHAEVVDVDEGEGQEQEELRPLRGVAQEDLHVLDEQERPPRGERGSRRTSGSRRARRVKRALRASCALLQRGEVVAAVGGAGEHGEGEGGRPQRPEVEEVRPAAQAGEEALAGPEGGQEGGDRGLQGGEEGGDVGERLHVEQALGADEAEEHHDRDREQQPHEHQDVAGAPGREDAHQAEGDHARRERRG